MKNLELLREKIYQLLMSNPEFGLGEMNSCRDEAKRIVDEWVAETGEHGEKKFLMDIYLSLQIEADKSIKVAVATDAIRASLRNRLSELTELSGEDIQTEIERRSSEAINRRAN